MISLSVKAADSICELHCEDPREARAQIELHNHRMLSLLTDFDRILLAAGTYRPTDWASSVMDKD